MKYSAMKYNEVHPWPQEAYETLRDPEKKKQYDSGAVKPPPGGWYQVQCSAVQCNAVQCPYYLVRP
jgi:DnaJ-class molecular chaperone